MNYDNSKQVIIRKIVTDKPNAPELSVQWTGTDGIKYSAGLYKWTKKDGTPVKDKNGNGMYQGTYDVDTYAIEQQKQGMAQAKAAVRQDVGFSDLEPDIPFSNYELKVHW
jgi:hypothetical protein